MRESFKLKSFFDMFKKSDDQPKETSTDLSKKGQKVLFIQFNLKIDTHEEPDTQNFFRGSHNMSELFTKLFHEVNPYIEVYFNGYKDIYRLKDGYYLGDVNLKDFDFVFFGFVSKHGTLPLLIQNYLKKFDVPFLTYESFGLYDSKSWGMDLCDTLGYPYIPTVITNYLNRRVLNEIREWGYPLIVKDPNLDRGTGVHKVDNLNQLREIFLFPTGQMMIQKMIPNDGDFSFIVMKNKVEMVVKRRVTSSTEFRSNVALGGKAEKATLPSSILKMCEDISRHVNCDILGFDILQDLRTGKYYVMEINISPHFSTFCVVSGVNLPKIITDYIIKEIK